MDLQALPADSSEIDGSATSSEHDSEGALNPFAELGNDKAINSQEVVSFPPVSLSVGWWTGALRAFRLWYHAD